MSIESGFGILIAASGISLVILCITYAVGLMYCLWKDDHP